MLATHAKVIHLHVENLQTHLGLFWCYVLLVGVFGFQSEASACELDEEAPAVVKTVSCILNFDQ